ncbi:MAG TPA: NUDIX domain-containing protein [Syntrophorhabdaceae bacterium]|nr:NUDIX domain-containing protein [Syntrophorhabdaceae bacterium]
MRVTAREGKRSAGLLMYRRRGGAVEVLLIHPGGPFWSGKDDGAWSIPKGLIDPGEDGLLAAIREFEEETGFPAEGEFVALPPLRQPSGKVIAAWAFEGDCDPADMKSNLFSMEWPPRSGRMAEFPEADRAAWFDIPSAKTKIIKGQKGFIEELERLLSINSHRTFR